MMNDKFTYDYGIQHTDEDPLIPLLHPLGIHQSTLFGSSIQHRYVLYTHMCIYQRIYLLAYHRNASNPYQAPIGTVQGPHFLKGRTSVHISTHLRVIFVLKYIKLIEY